MNLRPYQDEAVRSALSAIESGRSFEALSITHVKELIEQNWRAYTDYTQKNGQSASIYSAGIGQKSLAGNVVFAGVQTLARRDDLSTLPDPNLILIDEAHLIGRNDTSQYGQILTSFPGRPPRELAKKKPSQVPAESTKTYSFNLDVSGLALASSVIEFDVAHVTCEVEPSRSQPGTNHVRIAYVTKKQQVIYIWILPEHPNQRARWPGQQWFKRRGAWMPKSAEQCVSVARGLNVPASISVRKEGKFWRLVCEHFERVDGRYD